jgi:Bax protein
MAVSVLFIYGYHQSKQTGETEAVVDETFVSEIPDFSGYQDVNKKKADFFAFLLPKIELANQIEFDRREFLSSLDPAKLSNQQMEQLLSLAKSYRVSTSSSNADIINALLVKVDRVPASLILAQSANESAWGTSRFAREGNNLFGLWCFTTGCGLKPLRRDTQAKHEVEKFSSVQDGVNQYIRTLNSHPAYQELREIRRDLRILDRPPSGLALAIGLQSYSERGLDYIDEIQAMIRFNQLEQFNSVK